jgi:hypothetical protein
MSPDYRDSSGASEGLSAMNIFVNYAIPRINVDNQAIEVVLAIGG